MEKKRIEAVPIEGMEQIGLINTNLERLVIKVVGEDGAPVPFEPVDFRRVDDGLGYFDYADVETKQDGTAAALYVPTEGGKYRIECYVGHDRGTTVSFTGMAEDGTDGMSKVRASGRPRMPAHPRRDAPELNPAVLTDDPAQQAKYVYPPKGANVAVAPKPAVPKTEPMAAVAPLPLAPQGTVEHRFFSHMAEEPDYDAPRPVRKRRSTAEAVLGATTAMIVAAIAVMGCLMAFGNAPAPADRSVTEPAPATTATSSMAANP